MMNIVNLHSRAPQYPHELSGLFGRMETAMQSADADIGKSIRLAKTVAPILCDQSSNARHIATTTSNAPPHEKVIAILMLGFPKNRALLPVLQDILHNDSSALRMAAAIAISQMCDGDNKEVLGDVLRNALRQENDDEVKNTIRQTMIAVGQK